MTQSFSGWPLCTAAGALSAGVRAAGLKPTLHAVQVELAKLRLPVQQDLTFVNGLDLFHLVSRTLA